MQWLHVWQLSGDHDFRALHQGDDRAFPLLQRPPPSPEKIQHPGIARDRRPDSLGSHRRTSGSGRAAGKTGKASFVSGRNEMNRHHALRFLLLKHLWILRAHVPAERHRRIAQSLKVEKVANSWVVSWLDGDARKTLEFALDDVALYVRGDLGSKVPSGSDARNEVLGERFARQALGIADNLGRQAKVGRFERLGFQLFGCAVVVAAMMATASRPALPAVALAAAMSLTEFW